MQPKVIRTTKGREFDFLLLKVYMLSTRSFLTETQELDIEDIFSVIKIETLAYLFVFFVFFAQENGISNYRK